MSAETFELVYPSRSNYQDLFGTGDCNIRAVEERYGVHVVCRDRAVKIIGEKKSAQKAARIINEMDELIASGTRFDEHSLSSALDYLENGGSNSSIGLETVILNAWGREVRPRSLGQCLYLNAMINNDIVFSIGPAGTGKTLLAVAYAVLAFKTKAVQKIILCRPAVEAGESLGYLPGDLMDKVEPYFRPLYDALFDTLGSGKACKAPGAWCGRGRTSCLHAWQNAGECVHYS